MSDKHEEAFSWQVAVWNRMSSIYLGEVEPRFAGVIDGVMRRAGLRPGERVLDLGTGTGSAAIKAAASVALGGEVIATDISPQMLAIARERAIAVGLGNVPVLQGRGEKIPALDGRFDAVLASLSLMYVIDRGAAACEIARVLRPGGRLIASVWGGPEQSDIVLFQQTDGSFAAEPPIPGVGPGALAAPAAFLAQLERAGIRASVESETTEFDFDNFDWAWDVLAGVTAAQLPPKRQHEAKAAVRAKMWPNGDGPRHFTNLAHFIIGER
jgi:SAM-dependent methyltransferase